MSHSAASCIRAVIGLRRFVATVRPDLSSTVGTFLVTEVGDFLAGEDDALLIVEAPDRIIF